MAAERYTSARWTWRTELSGSEDQMIDSAVQAVSSASAPMNASSSRLSLTRSAKMNESPALQVVQNEEKRPAQQFGAR